jgi:hypothetical protein
MLFKSKKVDPELFRKRGNRFSDEKCDKNNNTPDSAKT